MTPSRVTMRRLANIRLLLNRAEEDSQQSMPFAIDCINRLHDATEMFLILAIQEHHKSVKTTSKHDFTAFWKELGSALDRTLPYGPQMDRFNRMRVELKHRGTEPSEREIAEAVLLVRNFIKEECPELFGVQLSDVSLSHFIQCERSRELIKSAEARWAAGDDETEAFADLTESFKTLIDDYNSRKRIDYDKTVFEATSTLRREAQARPPVFTVGQEARIHEAIIQSIYALDQKVNITGFGIDLRRYGKFQSIMPYVRFYTHGRQTNERDGAPKRTQHDFEFCRDFVVSAAIRLAEFDYEFDHVADYRRYRAEPQGGTT